MSFIDCKVKATFIHPSGIQYKEGSTLKLTPAGVKAWLKEGWIIDPNPAPVEPVTPVAETPVLAEPAPTPAA